MSSVYQENCTSRIRKLQEAKEAIGVLSLPIHQHCFMLGKIMSGMGKLRAQTVSFAFPDT